MQTRDNITSGIQEIYGFDEQTKFQLKSLLEEIDRKHESSFQNMGSEGKPRYIKFTSDKESKILSFTGKVDKIEVPARDFETGQEIPGKYTTRYLFECYDITTPNSEDTNGMPSIWERGTRDAQTILNLLSKNFQVLEIIRNGQPNAKTTTYLIYPRLD
ncbi:MAG TPA: hypothetical protein VH796_01765 [Nitrososphaeraceae archaeon]|jgi:hypothetical protein